MFNQSIQAIFDVFNAIQANAWLALIVLGILWAIQLINAVLGYRLNRLGLYPRHIQGIPGIFFSPLLHGSFTHLFFNSIPFFVLLDFILMNGQHFALQLTLFIVVINGVLLWLFGRPGCHVGASGLIMGYLAYLLVSAYHAPSVKSVLLGLICLYYFGCLLLSVFPKEERVSWEGHFFGLIAGLSVVFMPNVFGWFSF
jgi:membrane associated rhomboid family serine protease